MKERPNARNVRKSIANKTKKIKGRRNQMSKLKKGWKREERDINGRKEGRDEKMERRGT